MRPPASTHSPQSGLTLIELAIALVIIGLLTGAVMGGREMIRQSELLSIISQVQRYTSAVDMFQKKYNALPGDMTNAETFWGTDPGACPNTAYNTTIKITTCNGNGDGRVYDNIGSTYPSELHRFWQHLSNARMIDGGYTGARGDISTTHPIQGVNAPTTRVKGSTLQMLHNYHVSGDTNVFPVTTHSFDFCSFTSGVCAGVLLPSDARFIDAKADDGLPSKGQVITWKPAYLASCADSSNENTAKYNVTSTTKACGLKFLLGF